MYAEHIDDTTRIPREPMPEIQLLFEFYILNHREQTKI